MKKLLAFIAMGLACAQTITEPTLATLTAAASTDAQSVSVDDIAAFMPPRNSKKEGTWDGVLVVIESEIIHVCGAQGKVLFFGLFWNDCPSDDGRGLFGTSKADHKLGTAITFYRYRYYDEAVKRLGAGGAR